LRTTTHSTPVASCFSMGQLGQKTRLSSPEWGAPWSYGYTGTKPQAPGQIHIVELAQHLSTLRTQM
jgi:3-dehydroquinate dehydratase